MLPPVRRAFPPAMRLEGLAHYWQTWNNCGPATLSMNLSYFGIKIGQEKIGPVLKPERDDKNVGPEQLADYARSQGLKALVRVNGDTTRLKALLQAGVPVLVETWYEPKPNDGMGHYRLIVGYDDAGVGTGSGHWIAYDSYDSHGIKKGDPYAGVNFPYDSFDKLWKVFGRTYIPVYDEGRAAAVEAVLGADMDDAQMWQRALAHDLAGVNANPEGCVRMVQRRDGLRQHGRFQDRCPGLRHGPQPQAALAHAVVPVRPVPRVLRDGTLPGGHHAGRRHPQDGRER